MLRRDAQAQWMRTRDVTAARLSASEYATIPAMLHGELPANEIHPDPSPASSPSMPLTARLFRWGISVVGLGLLLLLLPRLPFALLVPNWSFQATILDEFVLLTLASIASELALTIRIDSHRSLSFSAAFTFVAFLTFGTIAAATIQVSAWLIGQTIERFHTQRGKASGIFIWFNAGQLTLCGLSGGAVVWLLTGAPLAEPPQASFPAIIVYAITYLCVNVLLTTIATWLRFGPHVVKEQLWPSVSLWTILSFALGVPLAFLVVNLGPSIELDWTIIFTFGVLATLSYIARINLRYQAANRDLQVLNEISETLARSLDLNDLFPAIYNSVRDVMPVDVFLIGLVNDERTEIEVPYIVENGEELAPRTFPLESSLADQVLRTTKPLMLPSLDVHESQQRFGRSDKHSAAVMFVPLCLGEQAIGVLSAQSYTPNVYSEQQLRLLEAIGRFAAIAINNARLFAREKDVLRSREEFVSLVAHELKNPLAALMGHTQILERRVRLADAKLRRPVHTIQEQGERMNRLVEDLLDLSRADSGRLALHVQRFEMLSLVRHVVEQQRVLTTQHQFMVESDDGLPLLEGDVLRLTQVLQNLLSNAVKYSPNGGTITVRVTKRRGDDPTWPRRVRKTVETTRWWVVVQVSDQGIGVPPDQIQRIFDRFYRANNTAQLDVTGTGLGLSVCEGLIRTHGGAIWAESEWGAGSTFSFALPVPPHEAVTLDSAGATSASPA